MQDRYYRQMKKGVLELVILQLISHQPTYGYQLISTLESGSNGLFALKEGTLYPILYRLEDDGAITSRWEEQPGRGVPKKYYTITEQGRRQLCDMRQLWQALCRSTDHFLGEE
ncbi:PadR family transcriptional regulator [Neobittarella massiliensis]|uniref:PadR family transcriptional regulator n=2 Tax=Oscillospiraceae TaxID=216572 RepID=A0A8J6LYJ9_9FIRM|nr:PadR family transcriptional regulator [Neobittarella massiliensis]MBC3515583.1 PadR family transcriptional regulator [Neobittarella massiliensis]SCJ53539.1 Transcriptional regulator YqjI [uncultured Anaerotruncus sp.]